MCCRELQGVAVYCSVLPCVAVCGSVSQCVAVCCRAWPFRQLLLWISLLNDATKSTD